MEKGITTSINIAKFASFLSIPSFPCTDETCNGSALCFQSDHVRLTKYDGACRLIRQAWAGELRWLFRYGEKPVHWVTNTIMRNAEAVKEAYSSVHDEIAFTSIFE